MCNIKKYTSQAIMIKLMMKFLLVWLMIALIRSEWIDNVYASEQGILRQILDADVYRALIIRKNRQMVKDHNDNPNTTFKMEAYAMFVALTDQEINEKYFMKNVAETFKVTDTQHVAKVINSNKLKGTIFVDLTNGYGTPVLNQGGCGNCYAFATTDAVNMNNKKLGRGYPLLSPQQLTDCSYNITLYYSANNGCSGGYLYTSMEYMRKFGVSSLASYALNPNTVNKGLIQPCLVSNKTKYKIKSWKAFAYDDNDCTSRVSYMLLGYALSVGVAARDDNFKFYKNGTLPGCYYNDINHAVVMVGAFLDGTNLTSSYVILKNSWGIGWGESGKIRISLAKGVCMACQHGLFSF